MQQFANKLLPESHPMTKMCKRVVARLAPATGMQGVDWKVHVIDENVPNAFVIPGGQIFVFSVFPRLSLLLFPFILAHPFYPSTSVLSCALPPDSLSLISGSVHVIVLDLSLYLSSPQSILHLSP
jgi:hypothetical protein